MHGGSAAMYGGKVIGDDKATTRAQPVFKLIVPWKYLYPCRAIERDEL
jgi:hypothetical protein